MLPVQLGPVVRVEVELIKYLYDGQRTLTRHPAIANISIILSIKTNEDSQIKEIT